MANKQPFKRSHLSTATPFHPSPSITPSTAVLNLFHFDPALHTMLPKFLLPVILAAITIGSTIACDDSYPKVAPLSQAQHHKHRRRRQLVALPSNPSSFAPLCPDGIHIDTRQLQYCHEGSCWNEFYNSCTFECMWRPGGSP